MKPFETMGCLKTYLFCCDFLNENDLKNFCYNMDNINFSLKWNYIKVIQVTSSGLVVENVLDYIH